MIALLNILDGVATYYGLTHSLIKEANPIMDLLWKSNSSLFLLTKIALSAFLLYISYRVFTKSGTAFRRLYTYLLAGVASLYGGIFILHTIWIMAI